MKLKIGKVGESPVVEIHGKVAGGELIKLSKKLEKLAGKKPGRVLLDLSNIHYFDSNWLGVLVYCWRLFRDADKELLFLIPRGDVLQYFADAGLDRTFTILHSIDQL
jgi:anti-anti-sigma factor